MTSHTARDRALTLAALCGSKMALGPALLQTARRRPGASNWVLGALGEMLLDKLGVFPPRYRPSLLIPHAIAGAWIARESLKADGEDDPAIVALGAAAAAGVSVTLPVARLALHGLGFPDVLVSVAEDAVAVAIGAQAVGLPIERVADAAREAVEEARDQLAPALEGLAGRPAGAAGHEAHAATA